MLLENSTAEHFYIAYAKVILKFFVFFSKHFTTINLTLVFG